MEEKLKAIKQLVYLSGLSDKNKLGAIQLIIQGVDSARVLEVVQELRFSKKVLKPPK